MSDSSITVAAAGPMSQSPPFTLAQWQELEHQALIFKYLKAGLSVPPYLLLPIRNSFQSGSSRFLHHPTLGYSSYCGKKIDPEPGRCRRTDGKKWRCSKDAHPDSKYCERHMNRSRNRSRKPVESQTSSQSLSTMASEITTRSSMGSRACQNPHLSFGSNMPRLQMEFIPYGVSNREYRAQHGLKPEADEHGHLSEASGSISSLGTNSIVEGTWNLTSQIPSNPLPQTGNRTFLQNNCQQLQMLQDYDPQTIDAAMMKQQQQHYVFGRDLGSLGSLKHEENQSLQTIFDEWPKCRDLGSYVADKRSEKNSSSIQLSMAIPEECSFPK